MASPFPGMDPYLESADIWPDFHDRLANELSAVLNQSLPAPYYARLEMRREEGKHVFVEIRDPRRHHRLVTLIEILSPANKIAGADRKMYLQKREEIYHSEASLIEVDLLRGGERVPHNLHVANALARMQPPPDYLVFVNRAWTRGETTAYDIFPIMLRELLPCIAVPLRKGEPEIPLDLQYVFRRAYECGPYRRGAIDYSQPPHPPLRGEDVDWANHLLAQP